MAQGFVRGPKFLRLHSMGATADYGNQARQMYGHILKSLYEFWGFCVNGDNDLTGAKGFPTGSFSSFDPGVFQSGSSLLISGSDGVTVGGTPYFSASSADFTTLTGSGLFRKWLVTWKSGSTSSDDSVYAIRKVIDANTLFVDTHNGGTPSTSSNPPNQLLFSDRSAINYRIVDSQKVIDTISFTSGQYMVFQFDGAPDVNPGQEKSQVRLGIRNSSIAFQLSPSGSWNGSTFLDGGEEYYPSLADSQNSGEWGGLGTVPETLLTLIADRGFLFLWLSGQISSPGVTSQAGMHIEIPERLYPASVDPNPITGQGWFDTAFDISSTVNGYGGGWRLHGKDNVTRRHRAIVRSPTNDHFGDAFTGDRLSSPDPRMRHSTYDVFNDTIWYTDALLHYSGEADHFTLARCRLRGVRFCSRIVPNNFLIGTEPGNQWYHVFNSIMLPWDGGLVPRPLDILARI